MEVATRTGEMYDRLDLSTVDSIYVFILDAIRKVDVKGKTVDAWDVTLSSGERRSVLRTSAMPADVEPGSACAIWTGGTSRTSKGGAKYALEFARLTRDEFADFARGAKSEQTLRTEFRAALDLRKAKSIRK